MNAFIRKCAGLALAGAALFGSIAHGADKPPVLIGLDAEFGHKTSTSAQAIQRGMEIAIDEINRKGGVLGTPLVASVFHEDRWDYVFTLERRGVELQRYRLTVYFRGDTLERVVGDTMPTEAEFVARFDAVKKTVKVPVLQASEDELGKYPVPEAALAAPPGGITPGVYPPLE